MKISSLLFLFVFFLSQSTFSQDYRFGKVSKEELQQKQHPTHPEADAAILYQKIDTRFKQNQGEGFYTETEYFERIKIYTKEGFDWANKSIKLYKGGNDEDEVNDLKAYTYTLLNDKIEEEKLKNDGIFDDESSKYISYKKLTMPNVSEGCIIEIRYTVKSPFITNIDEFQFQKQIPVDKLEFQFAAPEYYTYKVHQKGWIPFNIRTEKNERTMRYSYVDNSIDYSFGSSNASNKTKTSNITFIETKYEVSMGNIPPLKDEPFSGNINNYASGLKMELSYRNFPNTPIDYFSTTWEDVSSAIYDSSNFGRQLDKSNYFDDDLKVLLEGTSGDLEKIFTIFEFVKNKMSWNSRIGIYTENGVKDAFKNGTGNDADINLMLVSMLKSAGLNANPILVSTKSNGIPLFPTRDGFNFVIAGVEQNGNVILMDATHKENEIDILSPEVMNWKGRMVRENKSSTWVSLAPKKQATQSSLLTAKLGEDLSVTGTVQTRFTENYALDCRNAYAHRNEIDSRKKLEESYGDIELSEIKFENLSTLYKPVALSYSFEALEGVEEVGEKIYLSPLLFLAEKENPFKSETRNFPINFSYPRKDRHIVNLELPQGYTVETLPESTAFALGDNVGSFKYHIDQIGNRLQISMELSINQPVISSQEYGNLKKFFQLLIDKENEKVVLAKI